MDAFFLRSSGYALIALSFIAIEIGFGSIFETISPYSVMRDLIAFLLFPYLGIKFLTRNSSDAAKATGTLVLGFIALIWSASAIHKAYVAKPTITKIISKVEEMTKRDTDAGPPTQQSIKPAPSYAASPLEKGLYALEVVTEFAKKYIEPTNTNRQELEKLFNSGILDNKIYIDKTYLDSAQQNLRKISLLLSERKLIFERKATEMRKSISNLEVDDESKQSFLAGCDNGVKKSRLLFDKLMDAREEGVRNMQIILNLAYKNFGKVTISDGMLHFPIDADAQAYNEAGERINKALEEEKKAGNELKQDQHRTQKNLLEYLEKSCY